MSLKLTVSKLTDSNAAESIKNAICTVDPTVNIKVDLESQTITVDPKDPNVPVASEESIRQAVTAAGYSIQN